MAKILTLLFMFYFVTAAAFNDEPDCFKFLKVNFFRPEIVGQALSLHNVPQSHWPILFQELQRRSQQVPALLRARTRGMLQTPFDYPFQGQEAFDLLAGELYKIFTSVMLDSQFVNPSDLKEMFLFIESRQGELIKECTEGGGAMERQRRRLHR